MLDTADSKRHSAQVQIELIRDGQRFPVAQCGGGLLIFDEPVQLPASTGELVLTVDGQPRRWGVTLRNGMIPSRRIEADLCELR